MLAPVLAGLRGEGVSALAHPEHLSLLAHQRAAVNDVLLPTMAAAGLHSAAMLAVAGVMAVVVYHNLGVDVARCA